jgi:hypothetical protein
MKKYRVYLSGWDFDTEMVIEAESRSKAKGKYITSHMNAFRDVYHKYVFFRHLRCYQIK